MEKTRNTKILQFIKNEFGEDVYELKAREEWHWIGFLGNYGKDNENYENDGVFKDTNLEQWMKDNNIQCIEYSPDTGYLYEVKY